ncbi:MAG: hypothetical protein HZB25_05900 [Candidatus Eisenbacteria bacterium]|nr:hypothetical protein [Candidatus Eisenbacteria bacterium]
MIRTRHSSRRILASRVTLVGVLCGTMLAADPAGARPTIRTSFFNVYPSAVGSRLDNLPSHSGHCGVCHWDFNGAGAKNPYGRRVAAVLGNFANNDAGRQQAIRSIEGQDSDLDGYTSLVEITNLASYANTPTFPGITALTVDSTVNVPNRPEITPYLTPTTGLDVTPPSVTVLSPNGGEAWTGGAAYSVSWTATDNVGVASVNIYYRDSEAAAWSMIASNLSNSGAFQWFVHNTPTTAARVRVEAFDLAGNSARDSSNAVFTIVRTPGGVVPTTLRDFHQPGTQPFGGGTFQDHTVCANCHGGYDPAVEPARNFNGSMMAQAARDPLFYACVAVAEQDAPSSGDLCLRCHTPFGWMSGRSQPTSGSQLTALDRDGVACDFCHRSVDPVYKPGVSPAEDPAVLGGLLPGHTPAGYSNGQYVSDPDSRKRGPFPSTVAPHTYLASAFHRSSEFCGTCHEVSNPAFNRIAGADYAPGPLDQPADSISSTSLMPLERTYSEWKASAFPSGVYAPDFAGNKADGIVAVCQDCHLKDVLGKGCNDPAAPLRADMPLHDMTGGNSWMPGVIGSLYPTETDPAALSAAAQRAVGMLQKAATVDLTVATEGDSFRATVTITNRCGHKLPTGYPEGRRMWLHLVARRADGTVIYESGAYDPVSGQLAMSPSPGVYEAELGLSPSLASAIGKPHGPGFHFALNDTLYKDTRIPPQGFTNAAFAAFGGTPVDPERPGVRYADGQNWDVAEYSLPRSAYSVKATLMYQTTSKEYVEFLRDENVTNTAGQTLYDAWTANGRAAPVTMAADSLVFGVTDVAGDLREGKAGMHLLGNPSRGTLEIRLELVRPAAVTVEVFDIAGRRVYHSDAGTLAAGVHPLKWTGHDTRGGGVGAGAYWVRVRAGELEWTRKVTRIR